LRVAIRVTTFDPDFFVNALVLLLLLLLRRLTSFGAILAFRSSLKPVAAFRGKSSSRDQVSVGSCRTITAFCPPQRVAPSISLRDVKADSFRLNCDAC
jgi:hypothetical protein